ncbi:MAG: 3-deoxy-D-manno-octulosonic acid transferase [Candidatus Binatia bacterium]|nr:3-deoxy-D-manno-octulosonic acid transferase [Candidatus Binatia bacterium]
MTGTADKRAERTDSAERESLPFSYLVYDVAGAVVSAMAVPAWPLLAWTRWGKYWLERLGRTPQAAPMAEAPVWIHAASVGEVLAAEPLVRELRQRRPGLPIFVSTTSVPGREAAAHHVGADAVSLAPLDVAWLTDAAVRKIRPRALVLIETELWPALIRSARRTGVPVVLVSGRISERAARRYARIPKLMRSVLRCVDLCLMQSALDAERICALGAVPERVRVVGNLKFARQASMVVAQGCDNPLARWLGQQPLLVAASTHRGEEELVLQAMMRVWQHYPQARLLLAPRRPERFKAVAGLLQHNGIAALRRSKFREPVGDASVVLLDTVGELPSFLACATAVFVGGTFDPSIGGHNVLEPALFAKPVAFGPHTEHVAEAAQRLLAARAGERVRSAEDLAAHWLHLLRQPEVAKEMGLRGREVVAEQRDVAARYAVEICQCIERGRTSP